MLDDILVEETPVLTTKDGKPRKRKPKKPIYYFTSETQQAILDYRKESSEVIKNKIFNEKIYFAFYKLAENIIHTFKFYYTEVDSMEDLKHEVITVLLEKINHYNDEKGKAYSYFGTIAKNYLIIYNNKNYKRLKDKALVEEIDEDRAIYNDILLEDKENNVQELFLDLIINYFEDNLSTIFTKKQELEVADAIISLYKKRDNLTILNKKALFIYVREITEAPTPIITKVLKIFKEIYKKIYSKFLDHGLSSDIFK
jgi:hypothetical protein